MSGAAPRRRLRRVLADRIHRFIGRSRALSRAYLGGLSFICRNIASAAFADNTAALLARPYWPDITFHPRRVILGSTTEVRLTPHFGEFDWEALFRRRLGYEQAVFRWLEANVCADYDAVVEIGANVGVYTVFLGLLARRNAGGRLRSVFSFEPSPRAFARLSENLACNGLPSDRAFRLAVGARAGFETLYEPAGHLTNGSLVEDFARIFSPTVRETPVCVVTPDQLEALLVGHERILFKIDVEGYEPELLRAFAGVAERLRPDFLIEVLEGAAGQLEALEHLADYERLLIGDEGLVRHERLFADRTRRDWLLRRADSR